MDPAGARSLRNRLDQQAHWRQAEAVRDGRQLPIDPDGDKLEEIGEGVRLYAVQETGTETRRVRKRLVEGRWRHEEIREPSARDKTLTNA